jgi:hypothetical protein
MKFKHVKMKIDDWAEIADNPNQRDTVTHAKKALRMHLSEFSETHAKVAAAELPDGTRYKLDGHTRSYLWATGDLVAPKILYCDLYQVSSMKNVINLYNCFDNQFAAETATDRLASAFNLHGVDHRSRIFKAGGTTTALKTIYALRTHGLSKINIADPVKIFKKAINIIDSANFAHFQFPATVLAATIMSVHRDGADALNFWKDYDIDAGKKTPKKFDAVYCLRDFVRTMRETGDMPRGSIQGVHAVTPQIIDIYESWGTLLSKRPKSDRKLDDIVREYCGDVYEQLDRTPIE